MKEEDFERLQERIDTKINGDYHPQRSALQAELDAARKLYEEQGQLNDIQNISTACFCQNKLPPYFCIDNE